MSRFVITGLTSIAVALSLTGCATPSLFKGESKPMLEYDYSLENLKIIQEKNKDVKACLGKVTNPASVPVADKEAGIREFSRCMLFMQHLMGSSVGNSVPPVGSPDALQRYKVDRSFDVTKSLSTGRLKVSNYEADLGGDGLYRVKAASWSIDGQYFFEIAPTGIWYAYESKILFEPSSKTVFGKKRYISVQVGGITPPRSAN